MVTIIGCVSDWLGLSQNAGERRGFKRVGQASYWTPRDSRGVLAGKFVPARTGPWSPNSQFTPGPESGAANFLSDKFRNDSCKSCCIELRW